MFTTLLRGSSALTLGALGAVLAFGAYAQAPSAAAQTHKPITQEEVQAYVEQIRKDAEGMMKPVNTDKILEWTDRNILDDAALVATVSIHSADVHKGSINIVLNKREILAMGGLFAQSSEVSDAIQDYSLDGDVINLVSHGADAATVHVKWRESITVDARQAAPKAHAGAAGAGGDASAASATSTAKSSTGATSAKGASSQVTHQQVKDGKLTMQATADCWHLLVRNGGTFAIGLSACTGVANL